MTEYGALLFFVAVVAFGIVGLIGGEVFELFDATHDEFELVRRTPPPPD